MTGMPDRPANGRHSPFDVDGSQGMARVHPNFVGFEKLLTFKELEISAIHPQPIFEADRLREVDKSEKIQETLHLDQDTSLQGLKLLPKLTAHD